MKIIKSPAFWVLLAALSIVTVANWNNEQGGRNYSLAGESGQSETSSKSDTPRQESLIREGSELTNIRARIKNSSNGRVSLYEEHTKRTMICLENLWLQRILTAQKNEDRGMIWLLTGRVTEFEGQNFFQILQAAKSN